MSLSDVLIAVSLLCLAYAGFSWAWAQWGPRRAESVKRKPRRLGFKRRSKGSNVQNPVNAGSEHQDAPAVAVNVQNVQAPAAAPAAPPGDAGQPGEGFTLTPRELVQLAEALQLRGEGRTVEECLSQAFGVKKGGSAGYVRAKALWDAATVVPGAAPVGTYAAPPRPRRRRAAAR
jgi:hypothetical protein